MQEDMRLSLPAAKGPEPEPERTEVRVIIGMDTQPGDSTYVAFYPVPGTPLEIHPAQWMPKPAPDAYMIRAILVESVDINAMGRAVWTIDMQRHGHGDRPFHPGDLVIKTPGYQGFFEVLDVELEHHTSSHIGLVVKPAPDLAFDLTLIPVIPEDDEPVEF